MLCTAASRLRSAAALLAPRRRPPTRHCSLPGASDYHIPVLGTECIEWLARDEGVFVDCTLGGGGHSSLLLERVGASAKVIGLDRDRDAIEAASLRIRDARFSTIEGVFDEGLRRAFEAHGKFTGVLMALGVYSHQIDDVLSQTDVLSLVWWRCAQCRMSAAQPIIPFSPVRSSPGTIRHLPL